MARVVADKAWPAYAVKPSAIADLNGYDRNARTHSDEQIADVAASIKEFGWTMPVLIDERGMILAGHGRVLAARSLGMVEVPTITAKGWSEDQKRAYVLADNQLALSAGWDMDLLREQLSGLNGSGFDLALTGFSAGSLKILLAPQGGDIDPDDVPEIEGDPISALGDVWILGDHRIVCGDSCDAETVAMVLNGAKPHLMVTDPPYGVEYDPDWRNRADRANGKPYGGRAIGVVQNDSKADWREAWALFPGDVAYVWHAGLFAGVVADSLQANGFKMRSQIIWAKSNFAIGRGDYHWHHEPCWYAVKENAKGHYSGDRKQTTLWQIPKPQKSETGHSTQKPVECMKRPIENNSKPGDAVYEPFSGSSTTIIAAEMTGRRCFAVELNPLYIDMAVSRWSAFTGKSAILEGDGRSFEAIKHSKLAA